MARDAMACPGLARHGTARFGTARQGTAQHSMAWHSREWHMHIWDWDINPLLPGEQKPEPQTKKQDTSSKHKQTMNETDLQ